MRSGRTTLTGAAEPREGKSLEGCCGEEPVPLRLSAAAKFSNFLSRGGRSIKLTLGVELIKALLCGQCRVGFRCEFCGNKRDV